MPLVSVIIPAYNSEKYIGAAIDSVLAQTYKNYEIIVVDDGSTDNTSEVVNKYIIPQTIDRRQPTVKYIYQQNKGPSAARNKGIKESNGEYIAFLDSDDMWLPEKLNRQMEFFASSDGYGLIFIGHYLINEMGSCVTTHKIDHPETITGVKSFLFGNPHLGTSTIVIPKKCFDEVGLFDETLMAAEDIDMWIRISRKYKVGCINEPLVRIRFRERSQSTRKDFAHNGRLRLYKKIFNYPELKNKRILKLKANSYMFFSIAKTFCENDDTLGARKMMIKSFLNFPFHFLYKKNYIALLIYSVTGKNITWKMLRHRLKGNG